MKKIKIGLGAILMALTALISDRASLILIYAASAFLHEMGHILAAKLLKIKIKEIRFGFSGVRICTDGGISSYKNEILLAMSGPLVNFLIIAATFTVSKMQGIGIEELIYRTSAFAERYERDVLGALGFFALSSALQGCINLLPVNTFDGGRILWCATASLFGQNAADRVLSVVSAFSAFVLWTVALYLMLKVAAGLGIYVFAACIFLSSLKDTELLDREYSSVRAELYRN